MPRLTTPRPRCRRLSLVGLLAPLVAACAPTVPSIEAPSRCRDTCTGLDALVVSSGPLGLSATWVPRGGFLRASLPPGYEVTVEPSDGATVRAGSRGWVIELGREGYVVVQAISTATHELEAQIRVRVSDDGPAVELGSPVPGAILEAPPSGDVELRGSVRDPLGEVSVRIGDVPVALDDAGRFAVSVDAHPGMHLVDVSAQDEAGNQFRSTHAFLVAARRGAPAGRATLALGDASLAELARIVSGTLPERIHLDARPEPVTTTGGHDVYFDGASLPGQAGNPGDAAVSLRSDGSLWVDAQAHGEVLARGHVSGWAIDGAFVAHVSNPRVRFGIRFAGRGDALSSEVHDVSISDDGVRYDVDGLPDWVASLFTDTVREKLQREMRESLAADIVELLRGATEERTLGTGGALGTVPLGLAYRLDAVSCARGAPVIDLAAAAHGERVDDGAPLVGDRGFEPAGGARAAVDLGLDLVNGVLYGLWRSGALSARLNEDDLASARAAVEGLEALSPTVDVLAELALPPLVEPASDGVVLSIGDLHVTVLVATELFEVALEARIGARLDVTLLAEGGRLRVVPSVRELHVDVGRRAFAGLNPEALERLVSTLGARLVEQLARRLESIPVARLDLSRVGLAGHSLELGSGRAHADADSVSFEGDLLELR